MAAVTKLRQDEPLRLDSERLAELYIEMGEARARVAIGRAMEDMAITLERLKGYLRAGRLRDLGASAARITTIADPLGLSSLSRVAGDVSIVAGRKDRVALAATMARLDRVAARSLKMVVDLQNLSG